MDDDPVQGAGGGLAHKEKPAPENRPVSLIYK